MRAYQGMGKRVMEEKGLGSQSSSLNAWSDRCGAQHSRGAPALHKGVPQAPPTQRLGRRWSCRGCLPGPLPSTQPSTGSTRKIGTRSYSHKDAANTDGQPWASHQKDTRDMSQE